LPEQARGLYSKHRPPTVGKGADDGIPDGLLQPVPVACRLRGGRDRTGVRVLLAVIGVLIGLLVLEALPVLT
jgi:hypothetical protein